VTARTTHCWRVPGRTSELSDIRRYNVLMAVAQDALLYSRLETVLANEIADGDLKVGDQLPTEDSLIARFGVSRITVRRAIQNLVSRGLVEIRRGKGTFVSAPKMTQELKELSGFVEDMHALGRKPTARVVSKEIVTADATVADQLALMKGERVVRIRRVRLADGIPLSYDEQSNSFRVATVGKTQSGSLSNASDRPLRIRDG
jgi:GntR family transcriptional regulator